MGNKSSNHLPICTLEAKDWTAKEADGTEVLKDCYTYANGRYNESISRHNCTERSSRVIINCLYKKFFPVREMHNHELRWENLRNKSNFITLTYFR